MEYWVRPALLTYSRREETLFLLFLAFHFWAPIIDNKLLFNKYTNRNIVQIIGTEYNKKKMSVRGFLTFN